MCNRRRKRRTRECTRDGVVASEIIDSGKSTHQSSTSSCSAPQEETIMCNTQFCFDPSRFVVHSPPCQVYEVPLTSEIAANFPLDFSKKKLHANYDTDDAISNLHLQTNCVGATSPLSNCKKERDLIPIKMKEEFPAEITTTTPIKCANNNESTNIPWTVQKEEGKQSIMSNDECNVREIQTEKKRTEVIDKTINPFSIERLINCSEI